MEDFETRREEILETYARYRELAWDWSDKAFDVAQKQASGDAVKFMARQMGIMVGNTVFFESEHEMSILQDFVIFGTPQQGERAIERFIDRTLEEGELTERERQFLESRRHDRFAVVEVVRPIYDFGMYCEDYLVGDELFIVDRNMSKTVEPGTLIAIRLIRIDDWYVSTGAGFTVDDRTVGALPHHLRRLYREKGDRPEEIPPLARRKFECTLFNLASRSGLTRQTRTE